MNQFNAKKETEKVIKFIKSTKNSINEDPIRLIRALRFSKTLDFNICDEDLLLFKELVSFWVVLFATKLSP